MAHIKILKDNELIGGQDNSDVYPVSSTQAIFSQTPDGMVPAGVKRRLENRLIDIEANLKDIRDIVEQLIGGNVISMSVDPNTINYGVSTDVTVNVTSAMSADFIKIYRNAGEEPIYTGSGKTATVVDRITPNNMEPVRYLAEVRANGITKTIDKEVTIGKGEAPISWSKNSDIVNVKEAQHNYPTLNNSKGLPISYISTNPSVASINTSTGVITLHQVAGVAQIKAVFSGNDSYNAKTVSYTLTVLSAADYYVGWATGENSGFDAFASLSTEQLLAISTDYNRTPTFNKTVSSSEAVGTRQIFFIMWRDESAPKSGSVTSGGITENLQASDFTDTNVFRATHADIIVDDVTYHVAGLRGAFDAGDKFVINF